MFGKQLQIIQKLVSIVVPLTFLGACQTEDLTSPEATISVFSVEVSAHISETKTSLTDNGANSSFSFQKGDKIGFFAEDYLDNKPLTCTNTAQGAFSGQLMIEKNATYYDPSVKYYSYYPYQLSAGTNPTSLSGHLPSIQAAPFDGDADYLVAEPLETVYDVINFPKLSFTYTSHLFSIVKLSVTNSSDDLAEEKILSIGLKSNDTPLAGSFTFNVTNPGQAAAFSNNPEMLSYSIRVSYGKDTSPVLGKNVTHTVYAVVNSADYKSGTLELEVVTTNYGFLLPTNKDVSLSREHVTVFPEVDLTDGKVNVVSNSRDILSFSLVDKDDNEYPAFEIRDTIASVQVPNLTDMSNLRAKFTHSGVSVSVDGVEQTSEVSVQDYSDFTQPLQFTVHSQANCQRSFTIITYDLPIVSITTPTPITTKKEWTDNCSITIREANGVVTDYGNEVQVRLRGNGTYYMPKKPYTIKLKSKASVLGMPADKRWNLLANFWDQTLIRNDVCLEFGHRADGMDWASHGKFVELFLNGEFLGNYYLCEHNKIAKDRVNITEMSEKDVSEEAITGGYLLEYDNSDGDAAFPAFKTSIFKYPVTFKSPDEVGFETQWAWMEDYINHLESLLSDHESLLAHKYLDYMDIDSFVDWWLVFEISGNTEPYGPRSCFMNKDRGGKLKAGPVWDFDIGTFLPHKTGFQIQNTLYYKVLFNDPLFVARVKERWHLLKENLKDMPEYIDLQRMTVARSAERNRRLWRKPSEGYDHNYENDLTVSESFDRLKSVYLARMIELDGLISALEATPSDKGTGNEDYDGQDDQTSDFGFGF